jgi:iron(III) transport system ATP-binding protein
MSEIVLTDLHKRFGDHTVLAGLGLSVPAGSFTAILGPSGAGKTTLLRLLAGFERPDRGTITIGERTLAAAGVHTPPERRRIGYVPQEGSLFPHLDVAANVTFGLPRNARRGAAARLLELVDLAGLERRYAHQLSGGQQQRVALARALAITPEVVLLDEPFASLDAHLRAEVRAEVRQILVDAGTTTLLVTHNQDEALSTADLVAVLRDGRIVQHAAPQDLYASPLDDGLAQFIGDANLIDGALETDRGEAQHAIVVVTALGRLPARWHGPPPTAPCSVTALVRPEQITVTTHATTGVAGRVLKRSYHGHDTLLHIELESSANDPPVLVRTLADEAPGAGERCTLITTGTALVWPRSTSPAPITASAGSQPAVGS